MVKTSVFLLFWMSWVSTFLDSSNFINFFNLLFLFFWIFRVKNGLASPKQTTTKKWILTSKPFSVTLPKNDFYGNNWFQRQYWRYHGNWVSEAMIFLFQNWYFVFLWYTHCDVFHFPFWIFRYDLVETHEKNIIVQHHFNPKGFSH